MKKSLIALTLAALPVAAMADVTLYGQIKAGVEVSKVKLGEKTTEAAFQTDERFAISKTRVTTSDRGFLFNLPDSIQVVTQVFVAFKADARALIHGNLVLLMQMLCNWVNLNV